MDKLNPPGSVEEYERLSTANLRYEGHGFDTTMVIPCPFCAAPDFHRVLIINSHEDLSREATCVHCGRSARMLITAAPGVTSGELVQTGGEDPPEWMQPWPRRMSREAQD